MNSSTDFSSDRLPWTSSGTNRGSADIVWSCFATLFVSSWAVLHLNIHGPEDSEWTMFWRRAKWMIITLLAPELITGMALEQLIDALRIRYELRRRGPCNLTQAFYIVSGGLRIQRHGQIAKAVSPSQVWREWGFVLARFLPETEDLYDKNKSNGIAKGLAIMQIGWFVAQCSARAHHALPISELELGTIAFVACTTMSYIFWWYKPMDIRTVTIITDEQIYLNLSDEDTDHKDAWKAEDAMQHLVWTQNDPLGQSRVHNLNISFRRDVTAMHSPGLIPASIERRIIPPLNAYLRSDCFISLPPKVPHSQAGLTSSFALFFAALTGAGFGAIHTAAWHFSFPTAAELATWRVASLLTTLTPLTFSGLLYLVFLASIFENSNSSLCVKMLEALIFSFWREELGSLSVESALKNSYSTAARILRRLAEHLPMWTFTRFPGALMLFLILLYTTARLSLILQMFLCFRSMPAEIYVTVEWLQYVPHI